MAESYEELIKRLRNCATQAAPCKDCDMVEDGSCSDTLMKQAADAIEELSMKLHGDEAAIAGMKREIERMVVSNALNTLAAERRIEHEHTD